MSAPPVPSNVAEIAAPLLLGILWNWTLFGVLVVQILYGIFLLETLQTALTGADLYHWFASGFGNMDHLLDPYASVFDISIIGSIVSGAVQYFFVYRVWVLSERKSWWLCVIISILSAVNTIAAFTCGIYAQITKRFISGWSLKIIGLTWLSGNTMADLFIVTAMLFYLTRRRNTEFGQFSNHALVRIVRLTVETNALTTTNGIIVLLTIIIFPHKVYYTCPGYILGKLYSNTLLLSLNNRISIREVSSARGTLVALPISRTLVAPTFKIPDSPEFSIIPADLEMSPQSFKEGELSGVGEVREKVNDIGKPSITTTGPIG
ncbi:hypothetical protein DFH94DRAFT_841287 [Russula ochroleuca]|uniref:DUF6534 domain-containing protein n=1 Tax=Russula ochroleuca TaxID=152965 RepID=A0A9P5N4Y8_9AGAM|nr:hypothetical protein DFH94DRAFT_841287 [Russula ochroleuca]